MEPSNPQNLRSATLIRRTTSPTKSLKKNGRTDPTVAADVATVEVEVAVEEEVMATAEVAVATAAVAEVTVEVAEEDTATEIADATDTRLWSSLPLRLISQNFFSFSFQISLVQTNER